MISDYSPHAFLSVFDPCPISQDVQEVAPLALNSPGVQAAH